jgi:uncharacterized protein GlcG (DUF336 family)
MNGATSTKTTPHWPQAPRPASTGSSSSAEATQSLTDNVVVGGIGVSGGHWTQDMDVAEAALAAIKGE